jgi:MtN3 and saliva related transmembrane protein
MSANMFAPSHLLSSLHAYPEVIGFWAAVLTTVAFAPQVVETWKTGGEGLSWIMLALFGTGTGLWFFYGVLRMSGPLMLANGLTGLQILFLIALKLWFAARAARVKRAAGLAVADQLLNEER